jgi:hypothetical protein
MRITPLVSVLFIVAAVVLVLVLATGNAEGANKHQIRSTICQVFGSRCGPAIRVATCETGGTLNPHSRGSAGERGLFQIHPVHFGRLREWLLWQPLYNARVAYILSKGGRDWSAWTCQP